MRRFSVVLTALTLGVASAGAQDIFVKDFGTSEISYANGSTPKIRRGMTSRVRIVQDFIDFVPFVLVSVSGGGTIGSLSNGRTNNGTGFLAMDVTVPSGQTTNSTITLNVGLSQFNLKVVHRGLVSSITASPQPATLAAGTPWVATVQGTDVGDPVADLGIGPTCHSVTVGTRTTTSVQFTLTRQASCSTNSFNLGVDPSANDDPPKYLMSTGLAPGLSFSYIPPPPSGIACVSDPSIGAPIVSQPANGQVLVFGSGTPSPTSILFRWDSLTVGLRPAPNREWLVTREGGKSQPFLTSTVTAPAGQQPSVSLSRAIPGTHTVTIRAKNCGQTAPATTLSFSTRY